MHNQGVGSYHLENLRKLAILPLRKKANAPPSPFLSIWLPVPDDYPGGF